MGRRQEPCGPARPAEDRTAKARKTAARRPEDRAAKAQTKARTAKAGFAEVVLVCGKCAKRQGVDRKRLGRALKRAANGAGSAAAPRPKARKVKVVETGCLGPCPKRMLTVATAASLARGRVVLLDPSLDAVSPEALSLDTPALPAPDSPDADD